MVHGQTRMGRGEWKNRHCGNLWLRPGGPRRRRLRSTSGCRIYDTERRWDSLSLAYKSKLLRFDNLCYIQFLMNTTLFTNIYHNIFYLYFSLIHFLFITFICYFIDFTDEVGALESVKAASEIISPVSGKVVEANEAVVSKPGLVNSSCYDEGWLFRVELASPDEIKSLMDEKSYGEYVKSDPH